MNTRFLKLKQNLKGAFIVLLALCLLLPLASCKKEPELKAFTNTVGGYSFSYPEDWKALGEGSVTYISIADVGGALPYAMVRFSVYKNAGGVTAEDYWNSGVEAFSSIYESYNILQNKRGAFEKEGVSSAYGAVVEVKMKGETKLSGQPENDKDTADYTVHQLVFEGDGRLCIVSYMSSKLNYNTYGAIMDDIKKSFAFVKPHPALSAEDKGLADFNITVPDGWALETAEAFYTLRNGNATIIACVYSMTMYLSPKDYWEQIYRGSVQSGIESFKEGVSKECKMGGVAAFDVSYTGKGPTSGSYNFRQCIAVKDLQAFVITMTADDNDLEKATAGYEAVVKEFSFK